MNRGSYGRLQSQEPALLTALFTLIGGFVVQAGPAHIGAARALGTSVAVSGLQGILTRQQVISPAAARDPRLQADVLSQLKPWLAQGAEPALAMALVGFLAGFLVQVVSGTGDLLQALGIAAGLSGTQGVLTRQQVYSPRTIAMQALGIGGGEAAGEAISERAPEGAAGLPEGDQAAVATTAAARPSATAAPPPPPGPPPPGQEAPSWRRRLGWIAALLALLLGIVALILLLSTLPRPTAHGARAFNISSLGLLAATVGLAIVAFAGRGRVRQAATAGAIAAAVLAFVSQTASGIVVDKLTNHATPTDCIAFFVELDQLADDEPGLVQQAADTDPQRTKLCKPPLTSLGPRAAR